MSFFAGINTEATEFEMGGEDFAPIPDGTRVVATCEEAKTAEWDGKRYINLKWRINLPQEYANRVIFQKLHVYDPAKADRARSMLAAISTNAGGRMVQMMQQNGEAEPSDASLQALTNSPMVLMLGVWELDDKSKSGNWVKAVSKYERQAQQPQASPASAPQTSPASVSFEDNIPF